MSQRHRRRNTVERRDNPGWDDRVIILIDYDTHVKISVDRYFIICLLKREILSDFREKKKKHFLIK